MHLSAIQPELLELKHKSPVLPSSVGLRTAVKPPISDHHHFLDVPCLYRASTNILISFYNNHLSVNAIQ